MYAYAYPCICFHVGVVTASVSPYSSVQWDCRFPNVSIMEGEREVVRIPAYITTRAPHLRVFLPLPSLGPHPGGMSVSGDGEGGTSLCDPESVAVIVTD